MENKKTFNYEIDAYEKILTGTLKTFSPYFFNVRYRKKRLTTLIKYLLEQKLEITPEEALTIMNKKILSEYKLSSILKYIDKPVELEQDDLSYIVYYAYPYLEFPNQRDLTIDYYKKVLKGEKRSFPKNYFLDGLLGEKRAKYCIEYLCEDILKLSIEEIPDKLTSEVLREYKLKILLTALYFSMHDLITNVYPNQFQNTDFM